MRWYQVVAVAVAEMRICRRLLRYWLFVGLSCFVGIVLSLHYCLLHTYFSSASATAGILNPCYLVGVIGFGYLLMLMAGAVFLGFELRARDLREGMVEVLDSRPISNLEMVTGRFLGLLISAWLPVVALALLLQLLGVLLPAFGSPLGEPIEPYSLVGFVVLMALPALACTLAIVFLVTLVARHRLLAVLLLAVVLGVALVASLRLPLTLAPFVDLAGVYVVGFPSEIVPRLAAPLGWLQRAALLLAAAGLLGVTAALHPRLDGGSRLRCAAYSLGVLLLAAGLLTACVMSRTATVDQLQAWQHAHAAHADEPVADLVSVSGTVSLDPGRQLDLALDLVLAAPPDQRLETAVLTLNPGIVVTQVSGPGGAIGFSHADGLLLLELPTALPPGKRIALHLEARGEPDRRFAYLDAARVPEAERGWDAQIQLLGTERLINDRRCVVLPAGVRWMPASGPEHDRCNPRRRPRDCFSIDLVVEVPEGWLVAAPGRRQPVAAPVGRSRFRFAPGAPVSEASLVASRFVSFTADIEGVHCELLLHPQHTANTEHLAGAWPVIRSSIGDLLRSAAENGLAYPYDGFTVVEVPATLRGYAGGWRLDTALAPPAMLLLRESSFPTCRFDVPLRHPERLASHPGGPLPAQRDMLERFFLNDFSGGNLLTGAARSFFAHQTAAGGEDALALEYAMEELSTLVVTGHRGYFSAHIYRPEINRVFQRVLQSYSHGNRDDRRFAEAVIDAATSGPEIWDTVLGISLRELDPLADPQQTLDVLTLKGGALARSLLDSLGRSGAAALLSSLRSAHQGTVYTSADVMALVTEIEPQAVALLELSLSATDLPGFVAGTASCSRLPDSDDGSARYQLLIPVRNDEPAPGLLRIAAATSDGERLSWSQSEPLHLDGRSALQYGVVLDRLPVAVVVEPYLSLNRRALAVPLANGAMERIERVAPFSGTREIPWQGPDPRVIVVDDLDDGCSVFDHGQLAAVRIGNQGSDLIDRGLPVVPIDRQPAAWSRAECPGAWGRYRHTVAFIAAGNGERAVQLTAVLPNSGSWKLELHLPERSSFRRARRWGTWSLELQHASGSWQLDLDTAVASRGWNLVGERMQLPAGPVTLSISNRSDSDLVIADAIRWTPGE